MARNLNYTCFRHLTTGLEKRFHCQWQFQESGGRISMKCTSHNESCWWQTPISQWHLLKLPPCISSPVFPSYVLVYEKHSNGLRCRACIKQAAVLIHPIGSVVHGGVGGPALAPELEAEHAIASPPRHGCTGGDHLREAVLLPVVVVQPVLVTQELEAGSGGVAETALGRVRWWYWKDQ
jgi:hypothetical protein